MKNNDENNEFLNEIQQKINKRSGGLYYNKKLKTMKKNLTITSLVVIIIIILWALVNFIYQRVSLNKTIINKTPTATKNNDKKINYPANTQIGASNHFLKNRLKEINKPPDVTNKGEAVASPNKNTNGENKIKKQKYRYIFNKKDKIDKKSSKFIRKLLKKYSKTEGKDYYIYLIPETEIKNILKLLFTQNLKLKKESYIDITNYYQISIKKEILDIINKK